MSDLIDNTTAPASGRFSFGSLAGWSNDDLGAALRAYRLNPNDPLADVAQTAQDPRAFFETYFYPAESTEGHFTGYYEPELDASYTASKDFPTPIHRYPSAGIDASRAAIEPLLSGCEIAWLRDPVARFFLQVQGSGRLRFADGSLARVGYAGTNGHPYRSIGKFLIEKGLMASDLSAEDLKSWLRADLDRATRVMNHNPSYVMFRLVNLPEDQGPQGTFCTVTPGRTLAVDPEFTPLGTPVWVRVGEFARLCIAQDTGSAIKGPGRADLFVGTGDKAGAIAGKLNQTGVFQPLVRK